MTNKNTNLMDKISSLCKRRGIIFQSSEIYGGLANAFDYGPIGVELKNNIKKAWWKHFVQEREDIVGLDASILMNPKVWEASGHLEGFNDPLTDCKNCQRRLRADKLIEEYLKKTKDTPPKNWAGENTPPEKLLNYLHEKGILCPYCEKNDFTAIRNFNLMFKTYQGVTERSTNIVYLRPETAQGIFVTFKNVLDSLHLRLPFGIAQIGKAFRNEITPGNFIFRTREFEQMEIEYFLPESIWKEKYEDLKKLSWEFFTSHSINEENLRWRKHGKDELSHYSKMTYDLEYLFPWDWDEIEGFAYRTDYDLKQHTKYSEENMFYLDPQTGEKFIPHCIEPSFGVDRLILSFLLDAYTEEEIKDETRTVLKLDKKIAPIKIAVLPLSRNKELIKPTKKIFNKLKSYWMVQYDDTQSIGKRYRRQDEIGTPYCVTIDFDTLEDESITIRDRDTMEQERVKIEELENYLKEKLK